MDIKSVMKVKNKNKVDQSTFEAIEKAMDLIIEEFGQNEELHLQNEIDRRRYLYDSGYFKIIKEDKGRCTYPGCEKIAIKSHSIQKSASLKIIAEDNHVSMLAFDYRTEEMKMKRIGVNDASTFPGFCSEHELMFQVFETKGNIESDIEKLLQLYRSCCREIYGNQKSITISRYRHEQYLNFRNLKFKEMFLEKLEPDMLKDLRFDSIRYDHLTTNESLILNQITVAENHLKDFLYPMHKKLLKDIGKGRQQSTFLVSITVDIEIPCCLAGITYISGKGKVIEPIIVNVLPQIGSTMVLFAAPKRLQKRVEWFVRLITRSVFHLLESIEHWILDNSDHWFIRPSVWDYLNDSIKDNIINKFFLEMYSDSNTETMIFIQLRKELIHQFLEHYDPSSEEYQFALTKRKSLIEYLEKNGWGSDDQSPGGMALK